MAKKVVATLKKKGGKGLTKVIKLIKSEKTGAYVFKEKLVSSENVKKTLENMK